MFKGSFFLVIAFVVALCAFIMGFVANYRLNFVKQVSVNNYAPKVSVSPIATPSAMVSPTKVLTPSKRVVPSIVVTQGVVR